VEAQGLFPDAAVARVRISMPAFNAGDVRSGALKIGAKNMSALRF
jgi:hypothetical protein